MPKKKGFKLKMVILRKNCAFYSHDGKDKLKQYVKESVNKTESVALRNIQTGPLFKGLLLNKYMFNKDGNRIGTKDKYPTGSWGDPSKKYYRGPIWDKWLYTPPFDWIGYGLKIDRYSSGGNWLSKEGWWNAYHGVRTPNGNANGNTVIGAIIKEGFKAGINQNRSKDEDLRHPGKYVGEGCYFSPNPNVADFYAAAGFTYNGMTYQIAFKVRINPKTVRIASKKKDYWVCNGKSAEVKPTTLLVKKV